MTPTQAAGEGVAAAEVEQTQGPLGCYDVCCYVQYGRRHGGDTMRNALYR